MTQKEKSLLLKDLSARLPYGIKFLRESWNYEWNQELSVIEVLEDIDKDGYINNTKVYTVEDIKPYLRTMSSMTEEEKVKLSQYAYIGEDLNGEFIDEVQRKDCAAYIDWLNKNHFDYRGLIEKGLAVEVTEKNNPYKLD